MNKRILIISFLSLMSVGGAHADECRDRLVALVGNSTNVQPSKGHIITEPANGPKMENEFFVLSASHMLFKPIDPPNLPWTLTYIDAAYTSPDEGQTWNVAYTFDPETQAEASRNYVETLANSAINVQCGTDEIDGVTYDVLEADMSTTGGEIDTHSKYWVDPANEFVVRAETLSQLGGMDTRFTQTWEPVEGLELPVPE
ncbi:MAG: hypothetical protein KDJ19_01490 [Hyphomicrobiaceae bacterium]|nr:hypothetical protein [Hyphomicrobiaceae bacterium]MCC0023752.1 hypothetical protein [Hyphomicrobiaceae bacterium]